MIGNHIKIAGRLIRRYKIYSLINTAGLAIGMAVTTLIALWVADELSFDRFNKNAKRIHRVCVDFEAGSHMILPLSMPALADVLIEELPEVMNVARISRPERVPVSFEDREFHEAGVCYADPSLFEIFSFPFMSGTPQSALEAPYTAVITEDTARKYFGNEDPVGRLLRIDGLREYRVTGIAKNVPSNSHFRFNIVRSFATLYSESRQDMENWFNIQYYAYLLLTDRADSRDLERKLSGVIDRYMGEALKGMGASLVLFLQPLTRIHLYSSLGGEIGEQGDISNVSLFSIIAVFVLLLACINFVNLATARGASRALEIGTRKTIGSSRLNLIFQFLTESVLFSLTAYLLAAAAVQLIEPWFESFIGRPLSVSVVQSPWLLVGFAGVALLVGILAGSYPAFYLSRFQPSRVLRHGFPGGSPRSLFRDGLVLFQFAVSITLIIGTATVYAQIRFMKTRDLGYDEEHVVVIPGVRELTQRMTFEAIRNEMMQVAGVRNAAGSVLVPTRGIQNYVFYPEGFSQEQPQRLTRLDIDPYYIETMDAVVVDGRGFSSLLPSDESESVLVNETAVRQFGWTEPLGKTITFTLDPRREGVVTRRVIGVVKDFHLASLHRKIEPLVLVNNPSHPNYITLRLFPEDIGLTLGLLEEKWKTLVPERAFDYFFLDEAFDSLYRAEERIGRLSFAFSLLAVFIGCLGLFGLAAYMTERRTKEIGIRKVLGASVGGIVGMLSREYLRLVLLANVLAWPAAAVIMNLWLRSFPYRVSLNVGIMLTAGILALVTAELTVSLQAIKAARANPIDALRYE